jgi:hypothetical protein
MRKTVSLLLFILLVAACSDSAKDIPNEDNSWTGANLRGKVKTLTEVGFQASKQGEKWVKGVRNQTYTVKYYNTEGFLTQERTRYSDTNELVSGFNYVYDDEGNLTRINVIDPTGAIAGYSDIEERDGKVGIRRYTDFYGEGVSAMPTGKTLLTWENYKLKESKTYDLLDELKSTASYVYDENGDLSVFSIKNYGGQRDVVIRTSYLSFDEQQNWLSQLKEYEGYPITEIVERRYEYYE